MRRLVTSGQEFISAPDVNHLLTASCSNLQTLDRWLVPDRISVCKVRTQEAENFDEEVKS